MFQNMLGPNNIDTNGIKWPQTETGKAKNLQFFWSRFLDFRDIKSKTRENACNAMYYCLKILFKFSLPYIQLVPSVRIRPNRPFRVKMDTSDIMTHVAKKHLNPKKHLKESQFTEEYKVASKPVSFS